MTQVNPNAGTPAYSLAVELDKQDGNEDGKISASVWNRFVADKKYKGNNAKTINYFIEVEKARQSITSYALEAVNTVKDTFANVYKTWTEDAKKLNSKANPESNPNSSVTVDEATTLILPAVTTFLATTSLAEDVNEPL